MPRSFTTSTYRKLIKKAEHVLMTYSPLKGVDVHFNETFKEGQADPILSPEDEFVKQVLYGCVRYKKVLKIFLTAFYHTKRASVSNKDYAMYTILAYISLFRVNEIGFECFESIIKSQDALKMCVFLEFVFHVEGLEKWVKDEWGKVLEVDFIESVIIGDILRIQDRVYELICTLRSLAYGKSEGGAKNADGIESVGHKAKRTTTVRPFNLHMPRSVKIPKPMRIEQKTQCREPPNHHITLAKIEVANKRRSERSRADTLQKYAPETDSRNSDFVFRTATLRQKRMKDDSVEEPVVAADKKRESLRIQRTVKREHDAPSIRLTAAAILREDFLYRQKQQQQAQILREYETGLRDASSFYRWQSEMKQHDAKEKQILVDTRRREMELSHARAKEARRIGMFERTKAAERMKRETSKQIAVANRLKEDERATKQKIAKNIAEIRETRPKIAIQKVLNKKREHGDVEREKRRGRAEMIRCQREEEKLKREDLIRRIRALERAPRKTAKVFDPTKSSGIGLLDEMSLVELYERLEIVKAQARRDCERVRMRVAEEKRARQDDLRKRLENIGRLRVSARVANKAERERRRQMKLNAKIAMEKHREQSKRELARKLTARREALSAEFDALKQEELRVEKQRLLLGSNKLVIQQRHFKEQIKGAEREARIRQHVAQEDARRAREFAAKDRIVRFRYAARERAKRAEAEKERQSKIDVVRDYMTERMFEEKNEKRVNFDRQRRREARNREERDSRSRYAASISARVQGSAKRAGRGPRR